MQIKALRTFRCDVGTVRRGIMVDVSPAYAKRMIARGLAEAVTTTTTKSRPAQAGRAASTGAAAPRGE